MNIRGFARELVSPAATTWRWLPASRAAVSMAVVVGVPALLGDQSFGLTASTGVLSSLFFSNDSSRVRARRLPVVQIAFLAACAVGALLGAYPAGVAPALTAVDILAVISTIGLAIRPPGALFFAMGPGIAAAQVNSGAASGAVLLAIVTGAAVSYVVAVVPVPTRIDPASTPSPPATRLRFELDSIRRVILARLILALLVSAAACALFQVERPYWAQMAVISVLQSALSRRVGAIRLTQRGVGTVAGAAIAIGVTALAPSGVLLAILAAALLFGTEVAIGRYYGLALLFLTPLALILAAAGDGDPIGDSMTRVIATTVGVATTAVILIVVRSWGRRAQGDGDTQR